MQNWIKPFHDRNDGEYHYFSVESITKDVQITQDAYDMGLLHISSGLAQLENARFDYNLYYGERELVGNFRVRISPHHSVEISITKNKLIQCRCSDYSCYRDRDRSIY